jgi:hypothetical protein
MQCFRYIEFVDNFLTIQFLYQNYNSIYDVPIDLSFVWNTHSTQTEQPRDVVLNSAAVESDRCTPAPDKLTL